jgi:CRISPR-associated protein Cmr2
MSKYTGLSIGPIFKTIQKAKKTREIWLSSYIFSYIMKEIIRNLLKKGIKSDDFITPYVENKDNFFENGSVGKFHDRLIYKGDKVFLDGSIEEVLKSLAEIISTDLNEDKENVLDYLKGYFHFFKVEIETDKPIEDIYNFLNSKEMFYEIKNFKKDYLFKWIKLQKNQNSFYKNINKFKSLPEIAMLEKIEGSDDENKDFQKVIKKLDKENRLKPYHKYVAIVNADGDNLSKAIENRDVKEVSKKLFNFSNKAVEKIQSYGGDVIYAGGDDLLFFAPVKTEKSDIFTLLKEISKIYNIENSTISFGVSITFYKFPLNEALNISRNLLNKAKENGKNAIAFEVIKHSGQAFGDVINKNDHFDDVLKFLNYDEDEKFLHSLYSRIFYYKTLLKEIKKDEDKLNNFFEHFFNENYLNYEDFLKEVSKMIYLFRDLKKDEKQKENEDDETIKFIYSLLRYMKFLKGEK